MRAPWAALLAAVAQVADPAAPMSGAPAQASSTPLPGAPAQAFSVPELHGASDAFAAEGVALAWGVLRGRDDKDTQVVVRIEVDPARYADVQAVGIDPFTHASRTLPTTASAGAIELRAARADFADWPRTELRFRAAAGDAAPARIVYYLGVPDTTPEFTEEGRLQASLDERIARARKNAQGRTR